MANLQGCAGEGSGRDVPRAGEPPPTKHRAEGEDGRAKKGSAECRVTHGHSREGGKMDSRLKCNTGASISEGLIGGQEAEALARSVVVALDAGVEFLGG